MNEMCVCMRAFVRASVHMREREREFMCVLEIVREYSSTILQAFVVCSCFIVIETPKFVDKFEDSQILFFSELKSYDPCKSVLRR